MGLSSLQLNAVIRDTNGIVSWETTSVNGKTSIFKFKISTKLVEIAKCGAGNDFKMLLVFFSLTFLKCTFSRQRCRTAKTQVLTFLCNPTVKYFLGALLR